MIHDKFTNKKISRQRKYQLRKMAEGKCVLCGKQIYKNNFCLMHAEKRSILRNFHNSSVGETEFLNYFLVPVRQIIIKDYIIDGIKDNIIYEYLGNYWHGNPIFYDANDTNKRAKKTFGELYNETFDRFEALKNMGYSIKYIWESDWNQFKLKKDVYPNVIDY